MFSRRIKQVERINIRGVDFDNVTMDEATAQGIDFLKGGKVCSVYTPNSEIVQMCINDPEFRAIVNSADMIIPDGIGVIKASNILGTPLKEKVAGVELGEHLLRASAELGYKVYFLGGKPGVAELAAQNMEEKYRGLNIVGVQNGYFEKQGEASDAVISKINGAAPELLFVCLGVPVQEKWIYENKDKFTSVKLALALGGSLDVYAKTVKRAPKIFIKLGLEWFYRLLKQPSRIGRMMSLPKFLIGTYKEKRKNKKNNANNPQ
jgi:N-acetylglucosaminyldiphosphoundecaprenol N-acetyl-beta-D-mannosaminyltransferase